MRDEPGYHPETYQNKRNPIRIRAGFFCPVHKYVLPWFGNQFAGKLAVASSPDVHLLRLFDEVVAEIRMRDRDQSLGSLPGRQTL